MNLRKITISLVILATVLFAWGLANFIRAPLPCEEPITYVVGAFDKRFGISQQYFLTALREAEAIWEKPLGIELFAYEPESGDLAVNLIYDYRQETTSALSGLESVVEEDKATYDALETRYAGLKTEYNSAKSTYDIQVDLFNKNSEAYQTQVESWNKGKRNSREQLDQLEAAKVSLEADLRELKILEGRLNEIVREINSLAGTLNRLADSLNLNVDKYNTVGASRGETFTGGMYYSAEGERGIDIYEFSSREKLLRIMAHELGHALGLEHIDDRSAIMYRLNEGNVGVLADTDLAALRALCYTKDINN